MLKMMKFLGQNGLINYSKNIRLYGKSVKVKRNKIELDIEKGRAEGKWFKSRDLASQFRNENPTSVSVLLAICSLSLASCRIIEFSASQPRSGQCSYEIGETVTLTCRVEDVSELSVIFRHGTNKAENGISHFAAYVTSKVPVNKHILHLLKITKLQWDDHGLWECMQGGTAWNATIDITVQSSIEPLRASLAPLAAASSDQLRSGAVAIGNEDGEVTPHLLYRKGIKTNPFNLTGGARITLECVTGCSFPATRHRSVFSNHSTAPEVIIDASSTTVIGNCSVPNEVSGMVTRSSVLLSCASFPSLVGSNEVSCSMVEDSSCRRPDCVAATRHIPVRVVAATIDAVFVVMVIDENVCSDGGSRSFSACNLFICSPYLCLFPW